eukprot:TRINITY_DN10841_c0_g1_i1.p1 TRINITY_DN10841_c0_g1~~TRINITY_DN10841_c0_g1_i1.p1  ORF type:complete len:591 (-),score=172.46 TRINITY_DN10841_c0_g1_i1:62-1834(-)
MEKPQSIKPGPSKWQRRLSKVVKKIPSPKDRSKTKKAELEKEPASPSSEEIISETPSPQEESRLEKSVAIADAIEIIPASTVRSMSIISESPKSEIKEDQYVVMESKSQYEYREEPQREFRDLDLAITVYQSGKVYFHEVRKVHLDERGRTALQNLPSCLTQSKVNIKSLTDPYARILEQSFTPGSSDESGYLDKIRNKAVLIRSEGRSIHGKIVSSEFTDLRANFLVEEQQGNKKTLHLLKSIESITLTPLDTEQCSHGPMLDFTMQSEVRDHLIEVIYPAPKSVEWSASYEGILNNSETQMELICWVSIANLTEKKIDNARFTLITEERATIDPFKQAREDYKKKRRNSTFNPARFSSIFRTKKTRELPMSWAKYLPTQQVTIDANKQKMVALVHSTFPVKIFNLVRTGVTFDYSKNTPELSERFNQSMTLPVERVMDFRNSFENGLGCPLPNGGISLARRELGGFGLEQFWEGLFTPAEANIGDRILLRLTSVPAVVVQRKQTAFILDKGKQPFITESFEISITNSSFSEVELNLEESLYRWPKWRITLSNPPHAEEEDGIIWRDIRVKPKSTMKITYAVIYQDITV